MYVDSSQNADPSLQGSRTYRVSQRASSCLDAFAQYQRAAGLPAQSVQWGAWTEIGMVAGNKLYADMFGVKSVLGLAGVGLMLAGWLRPVRLVANITWSRFLQRYLSVPDLMSGFREVGAAARTPGPPCSSVRRRPRG